MKDAGMAEQADAADSKSAAERRGGSSPSARTIQDLHDWNAAIFAEARRKAEERFDALVSEHNDRRDEERMPTLW